MGNPIESTGRGLLVRYGMAVLYAVGGLAIRLCFTPFLGDKARHTAFFLATAVSALAGGFGPGLVTTVAGTVLAGFYLTPLASGFAIPDATDRFSLAWFLLTGVFVSYLAGRLRDTAAREQRLRTAFEQTLGSIGDAVMTTDLAARVQLMNPVAEQLTGWTSAEAKGRQLAEVIRIVREGSDTPAELRVDKVAGGGAGSEITPAELLSRHGRRISVDYSGTPMRNPDGGVTGAVWILRDITARRKSERALEKAERHSREVLESITDGFIVLDKEWRILFLNPAGERIAGKTLGALAGRNHWEAFPITVGTEVERNYRRAAAEGVAVEFEFGSPVTGRWMEIHAYPSGGELAVYFTDITERKQSEAALQRLNEDLKQFTFAATHDLREPLRTMLIYAEMLQRRLGSRLDAENAAYIEHLVKAGERISRLIDGLLKFSKVGETADANPVAVSADAALQEALHDLHVAIAENGARLTHEPLPLVMAERVHLCQLFQNLVGNALKYQKPGIAAEVRISVKRQGTDWVFTVRDEGIGIAGKHFSEIFVPFKRLHGAEVSGAGIGLATCKRIVERYKGRIWVESEEGAGTAFHFTLPAAEGDQA